MALPRIDDMLLAEVVIELNVCAKEWSLRPIAFKAGRVEFQVGGNVLPYKPGSGNVRVGRGQITFFGDSVADAHQAIRSGLLAMREAQESKR